MAFLIEDFKKTNILINFIQGLIWQKRMEEHGDKIVIPLFLYWDEFQSKNLQGSQSNKTKIGGTYVSIPCLPPKYASKLEFIFVTLLFYGKDRKIDDNLEKDRNEIVFFPVIQELIALYEEGIEVSTANGTERIFSELGLMIGDNLGLHSMMNFAESFSATYSCRYCKVSKNLLHVLTFEWTSFLRNHENYLEDLKLYDVSQTGIKGPCIFHKIPNFQIPTNVGVDFMHDVLEGVSKYVLSEVLDHIIVKKNFINLDKFNSIVKNFKLFSKFGCKNLPPSLTESSLKASIFGLSASEPLFFVKNSGLIAGDFILREDGFWKLYLLHKKIVDFLMSPKTHVPHLKILEQNISEHHKLYINLTGENLKPKFHILLHYNPLILLTGPVIHSWTMRHEAAHRPLKLMCAGENKKYLLHTMENRYKLKFDYFMKTYDEKSYIKIVPKLFSSEFNFPKDTAVFWIEINGIGYDKNLVLVTEIKLLDLPTFGYIESIDVVFDKILFFFLFV